MVIVNTAAKPNDIRSLWDRVISSINIISPELPKDVIKFYSDSVIPVSYDSQIMTVAVAKNEDLAHQAIGLRVYIGKAIKFVTGNDCPQDNIQFVLNPLLFEKSSSETKLSSRESSSSVNNNFVLLDDSESRKDLYKRLVQPKRVLTIPRELLRWLPILGSTRVSMISGARESFFMKNLVDPSGDRDSGVRVSWNKLAYWSGLSEKTFRLHINDEELYSFIHLVNDPDSPTHYINPKNGLVSQLSNRFDISMDVPLTPEDEDSLSIFLLQAGINNDPLFALQLALDTEISKILSSFVSKAPVWETWNTQKHTVSAIIQRLLYSYPSSKEIDDLISKLSEHISPQVRGSVQVPWYRFVHWFPTIGQNPGWFTLLCQSKVFITSDVSESRDNFEVPGFEWFSSRLNIGDRIVRNWFIPSERDYCPLLNHFIRIDHVEKSRNRVVKLNISVKDFEPLIPSHDESCRLLFESGICFSELPELDKKAVVESILNGSFTLEVLPLLLSTNNLTQNKGLEKDDPASFYQHEIDDLASIFQHDKDESASFYQHETPQPASDYQHKMDKPASDYQLETTEPASSYQHLKDFKNNFLIESKDIRTNTATSSRVNNDCHKTAVEDISTKWDTYSILKRTLSNPLKAKQLLSDGQLTPDCVNAWLFYMTSRPAKRQMGVGAVANMLGIRPIEYPVKPFVELARLSPDNIRKLLNRALSGGEMSEYFEDAPVGIKEWNNCMKEVDKGKLKDLYLYLFDST